MSQDQQDYNQLIADINAALEYTKDMETEDADSWVASSNVKSKLENDYEYTINTRADLVAAKADLEENASKKTKFINSLLDFLHLYYSADGLLKESVFDAHMPLNYILGTNSMYYGYRGWYQNTSDITYVMPSHSLTIGDECFKDCTGLKIILIRDDYMNVGSYAFNGCTDVSTITLPCDFQYTNEYSFYGLGAAEIHFTAGKTGVMTDLVTSGDKNRFPLAVAYRSSDSVTKITFDEGITHIGDYYFYASATGMYSNLSEVVFPSTLKSIGTYAFGSVSGKFTCEFPTGLESI